MGSGPNWASLVSQNRAKAVGIAWSEKEIYALRELKIPAEYVRGGCLTLESYKKETGEKKSQYLKKDELLAKAKELGIEITDENVVTREVLIDLISKNVAQLNEQAHGSEITS